MYKHSSPFLQREVRTVAVLDHVLRSKRTPRTATTANNSHIIPQN